jgi:hypothetical protein
VPFRHVPLNCARGAGLPSSGMPARIRECYESATAFGCPRLRCLPLCRLPRLGNDASCFGAFPLVDFAGPLASVYVPLVDSLEWTPGFEHTASIAAIVASGVLPFKPEQRPDSMTRLATSLALAIY